MEVRIDAVGDSNPPSDTFVSLRVGDVQKQSRLSASRAYKFPKPAQGRENFGRIEVFKRIGHMTVKFDDMDGGLKDLDVPCDFPGMRKLSMRLVVKGAETPESLPQLKAKSGAKFKQRKDAAQKYLDDHNLEDMLADAMKELIQKKPRDPHEFLSGHILRRSKRVEGVKLPSMQPSPQASAPELVPMPPRQRSRQGARDKHLPPLPSAEKAVPMPPAQPPAKLPSKAPAPPANFTAQHVVHPSSNAPAAPKAVPCADLADFKSFYEGNFSSAAEGLQALYAKFPVAPRHTVKKQAPCADLADFKSYYKGNFSAAGGLQALYAKFPLAPRPTVAKRPVLSDFEGYYLECFTPSDSSAMRGLYARFEGTGSTKKQTAILGNITEYVQEHIGGAPFGALHSLHSKFPAYREATKLASAPEPSGGKDCESLASVGTWLSPKRPQLWQPFVLPEMPEPLPLQGKGFTSLPSVATWCSRPRARASSQSSPPAVASTDPAAGGEARGQAFAMMPSVGSWLAAKPTWVNAPEKNGGTEASRGATSVASLSNFSAYYAQNFVAGAMPSSVFSKFKQVSGPSKAVAGQTAVANDRTAFRYKPSVGSWLVAKPPGPKLAAPKAGGATWALKPSVGTWLSTRPPQQGDEGDGAARPRGLDRRDSEIERMSKDEVLTVVRDELASKDREIEELKAKLARLELGIGA